MGLIPMKVQATPGQVIEFICTYFSMEPLKIDIQPIGDKRIDGNLSSSLDHSVPVTSENFPWGGQRSFWLKIDPSHRQVKCRVTNKELQVLGELTAFIQLPGSQSNHQHETQQNQNKQI